MNDALNRLGLSTQVCFSVADLPQKLSDYKSIYNGKKYAII